MSLRLRRFPRLRAGAAAVLAGMCGAGVFPRAGAGETLTVLNTPAGAAPEALGYNLGHFMPESNTADWFRYSGAGAARVFISVSDIEPTDDLAPAGDGVASEAQFFARRARLRANAASPAEPLDSTLVNWAAFTARYALTSTGSNRQQLSYALGNLRGRGVSVLANLTASPSRFPVTGEADWAGKWELWQHYYAQAFLLSRDYGVRWFSMFNEPNGWTGMTEAAWRMRFRICSDALQHAVADMSARHGKDLTARIFAPNTANGAEKYNSAGEDGGGTWGHDAVSARHLLLDGTSSGSWMNLHVYNYQKYTTRPYASGGFSGFINDITALRGLISADMGAEPELPLALSEFNVRTGANYDTTPATQDSPADFAALGACCVALTENGVRQLYLFKFAQTASDSVYGVAKNGTHYVQNTAGGGWNCGGATKAAEVYRLFNKAVRPGGVRHGRTATAGASPTVAGGLWSLPMTDPATGNRFLFLANRETSAIPLSLDFSAWPVPPDAPVVMEEVSGRFSGGVVLRTALSGGKLAETAMPAQSVRLLTLPSGAEETETVTVEAEADTGLGGGAASGQPGGALPRMPVRSDGTADGRQVSLIRFPAPPGSPARIRSALLTLNARTFPSDSLPPGTAVQAHVYGVTAEGGGTAWTESAATWQSLPALLKQNVPAGGAIAANIVKGQGTAALMLGQLVTDSAAFSTRMLDVTDFVKTRPAGESACFLIVQEHRWDMAQPSLTPGDIQPGGILLSARESAAGGGQGGGEAGGGPRLTLLRSESLWTAWKKASFAAAWREESTAGAAADPDGDGVPNLLEYALNGPPLQPLTTILPAPERAGNGGNAGNGGTRLRLTRDSRQDDLRRAVQLGGSPGGPWTEAAVSLRGEPFASTVPEVTVTESPAGGPMREVILTIAPEPVSGRRFVRLRVELLEP